MDRAAIRAATRAGKLPPTRERLLTAASRLFAERGYEGVAVDEVVDAAAANKRMVYHYFGNKDGLFVAVLERAFATLQQAEEDLFTPGVRRGDARDVLADLVALYFAFLQRHPEFVRLLLWENLQGGSRCLQAGPLVSRSPMLRHVKDLLAQGEAEGLFRPGIDPRYLLISLIGLCLVYFSNRYTLSHALAIDLAAPETIEQAIATTTKLLLEGVCLPRDAVAKPAPGHDGRGRRR